MRQKRAEFVQSNLKTLETYLRRRFSNLWNSVRKAFLDLDIDHDGRISSEDIMRYFGETNKQIEYQDL